MNWKEKLAEANKLFEAAKAVLTDPEATDEQKSHVNQMVLDAQKLKTEALQLKSILEQALEGVALLRPESAPEAPADEGQPPAEEFKEWGDFLYAIWMKKAHNVEDARLKWFDEQEPEGQEKAMTGAVGARGGFLIAAQFMPTLLAVMGEDSIVRPTATIIRMPGRQISLPVVDQTTTTAGIPHWFGGMKFYWAGEGEEKEETEAKFRRVTLVAKKLIGHTVASDELLDDAAISLGDFLSGPLGFTGGVVWMEDFAFLMGAGGAQPRGVINAPVTLAPARQAAGTINYVDCINLIQNFLPSGRGQWVISQSAMADLVQMSGPTGNPSYIWQPNAREGPPGMLFGWPVRWTEKLPLLGTRGDILLADFRYYLIGDRQATTIDSSQYPRWIYDETSWRVVHRVDGQPWLSAPLTYQDGTTRISPFVCLGDVAS